ncbi:MBL fold metallo-hydrolase [Flexistipes sp.]|uniref:MBL fold metallo-hydrolase n=1 Tax=Flexistipes sp. TaxID=3088135 RepID=UPI002E217D65|nr:MBL fold metallo-hydrolase [Flexistipes sp.]
MSRIIFDNGTHRCIVFDDILNEGEVDMEDVQSNQFLIVNGDQGLLFDPGGAKVFQPLHKEISKFIFPRKVKKIVISHQDPDTGAGINYWMIFSNAVAYVPQLWVRFIPHFCRQSLEKDFFTPIPEEGMRINLNDSEFILLPAHFLHSAGNVHMYDTTSKILFSGDMGTSIFPFTAEFEPVEDFDEHVRFMEGFHRRYIASNKVCKLWANMVRDLDIEMIIPQHGRKYFKGKEMVNRFIDWVDNLQCGIDLFDRNIYTIPSE